MSSVVDRAAIGIDRVDEIIKHAGIAESLLLMKILTLPCQCTLTPTFSLPIIIAGLFRPDKTHIIPTPFTEAIVFEITEIIKYLRPRYKP
jgi:hypothetical protein